MQESKINKERKLIDKYDTQIVELINKRVKAVLQIGELKKKDSSIVYRPDREKSIFTKLKKLNKKSPFPDDVLSHIFLEIISACRSLEGPIKVGFLGPSSTFTHSASINQFGTSATHTPYATIADVFFAVENEKEKFGLIPIENSTEGIVNQTIDLFLESHLRVCSEVYLTIHQNLLSNESSLKTIKKVYSHPQAFAQCRKWITQNLPLAKLIEVDSTAEAAKRASKQKNVAAIASLQAKDEYKLKLLQKDIEDISSNYTRFIVVTKDYIPQSTGEDKTSLLFYLPDEPGALSVILQLLNKYKINMSKIVSRPSKRKAFEYSFFLDIQGHQDDKNVALCLKAIKKKTLDLKIFGSYPVAFLGDLQDK